MLWRSRNKRNVGSCWLKGFTGLKLCATTPNNMQQGKAVLQHFLGGGPWHLKLLLLSGQKILLSLKLCSIHWAPWILQVQTTGIPSIFLKAWPCEGVQTDATCNIPQCWELLANNDVSVCTGLNIRTGLCVFKSDLSEQIPLFPLPTVAVGM